MKSENAVDYAVRLEEQAGAAQALAGKETEAGEKSPPQGGALVACPVCQTAGFSVAGLKRHRCKATPDRRRLTEDEVAQAVAQALQGEAESGKGEGVSGQPDGTDGTDGSDGSGQPQPEPTPGPRCAVCDVAVGVAEPRAGMRVRVHDPHYCAALARGESRWVLTGVLVGPEAMSSYGHWEVRLDNGKLLATRPQEELVELLAEDAAPEADGRGAEAAPTQDEATPTQDAPTKEVAPELVQCGECGGKGSRCCPVCHGRGCGACVEGEQVCPACEGSGQATLERGGPDSGQRVLRTTTQECLVKLSDEQLLVLGQKLATDTVRVADLQKEIDGLAYAKKQLVERQKELAEEIEETAKAVKTKQQFRLVSCQIVADYVAGVRKTIRLDTGEVVGSCALEPSDRQMELTLVAPEDGEELPDDIDDQGDGTNGTHGTDGSAPEYGGDQGDELSHGEEQPAPEEMTAEERAAFERSLDELTGDAPAAGGAPKACPACGATTRLGELRECPHCGTLKCDRCDMGNDVPCVACEGQEGGGQ